MRGGVEFFQILCCPQFLWISSDYKFHLTPTWQYLKIRLCIPIRWGANKFESCPSLVLYDRSDDNTYNFRKFQTQLSSIWIDLDGGNPPSSHTPDRPNRRSAGRCRIVEIPCTSKYHSIYRNAMHECKHLDVFRQMN